ncbi:MAG: hypothetical protein QOI01_6474 [Mycobacterium sp.]|jgi:anti-sigma regulatory factor (Ser/Thr protein kinase)|nr:hypothetical protein [Mycobacterium sp.]
MSFQFNASFPWDTATPGRARSWAAEQISGALLNSALLSAGLDDVVLVVSELVTNALQAGCSSADLRIEVDADTVTVAVTDDAPGEPVAVHAGPEDVHGRGLFVVAALASDWGVRKADRGKEVWALLPVVLGEVRAEPTAG